MKQPRDQPRQLAPVLFSVVNIIIGISTFGSAHDHVPAYTAAARFLPLNEWGVSFIVLGAIIPLGIIDWRIARFTSVLAFGWWCLWAALLYQTVGDPGVSHRAVAVPACIAALHVLLTPYRRRGSSTGAT